jgi:hypothetical protein
MNHRVLTLVNLHGFAGPAIPIWACLQQSLQLSRVLACAALSSALCTFSRRSRLISCDVGAYEPYG